MKITQDEIVESQTVLHIELEDEDLDPYLDRAYRRVVQRTVIPGFRKGKAPRLIVERYVGRESLLNEVADDMLPEVTARAISEQELEAASLPRIELQELEPFTLKATVPLVSEVDPGPFRDIRIARDPVRLTKKDIELRLDQIRHNMASWEPVDRPVKMSDMVTIEAVGRVDGRSILDEKDAVFFLDEDGTRPLPGFSQHLVGLLKDKPQQFTLEIPQDYSDEAISGKEAEFSVTVGEIKERILPDLDGEFAKSVGDGYDSLDALRKDLKKQLTAEAENRAAQGYRESVVDALVNGASVELPPLMIEHEIDHMGNDQARVLERAKVRMDDYLRSIGKSEEEVRGELRIQAIERLTRTLVLSKVTELEGVEASDEEVEERVRSIIAESAEEEDRDQVSEELKGSVRRMLLVEKTIDHLVAVAAGEAEPLAGSEDSPADDSPDIQDDNIQNGGGADDTKA